MQFRPATNPIMYTMLFTMLLTASPLAADDQVVASFERAFQHEPWQGRPVTRFEIDYDALYQIVNVKLREQRNSVDRAYWRGQANDQVVESFWRDMHREPGLIRPPTGQDIENDILYHMVNQRERSSVISGSGTEAWIAAATK